MKYLVYCRKSSEGEERQVMSLASQQEALSKSFGDNPDVQIVGVYEEAKSAKTPGRPLFAEMLERIEAGEADGIASWAPDRLARNSIDGGRIIYMLDRGTLRDLKFATYTFENNPQGKFMLGIMFNQSKYYSDALAENVKRGSATKVAMGWLPNRPPLGYLNCAVTRTIIPDPQLFPLVRRMFKLFLTGAYTPRQIGRIAQDDWGFLTPRKARSGGKPIGRTTIYKMLANPFYAGTFEWAGVAHKGKHRPMLSDDEFIKVQTLLRRRSMPKESRLTFAFSGLLSCGRCGHAISAEHKTNRHGTHYIYYHCAARSRLAGACPERSVEERELAKQFGQILSSIVIRRSVGRWVRDYLQAEQAKSELAAAHIAATRLAASVEISTQLRELMSLRLRRLVDDEEFVQERQRLDTARLAAANASNPALDRKLFELLDVAERVSIQAVKWFSKAPSGAKRRILKIVCSNPVLIDKKVSFEAAKPFVIRSDLDPNLFRRGVVDDPRTITREGKQLLARLNALSAGEVDDLLDDLRDLEAMMRCPGSLPAARKKPSPPWLQYPLPPGRRPRHSL